MSGIGARARFLFREEAGEIDAPTWRRNVAWLAACAGALTLVWWALRPYAHHDLSNSAFLAPMTILAYSYLLVFTFAVLLIAISYTMLTIKRLRACRLPTGLAGLVPFLALICGAAHFLYGKTPDVVPAWYPAALDLTLAVAVGWTVYACGLRAGRGAP